METQPQFHAWKKRFVAERSHAPNIYDAWCAALQTLKPRAAIPVAEVVSKHGDPEAFGEREIKVLADLRKVPYGTKLYAHPPAAVHGQSASTEVPRAAVERIVHLKASRSMRCYIAGPMTGLPEFNFPAFNAKAAELRAQGWHVENPAEHGHVEGADWGDYLRYDISRIATCEAIFLLPGWSKSKGASLEVHIARTLDMKVCLCEGAESPFATPTAAIPAAPIPEEEILQAWHDLPNHIDERKNFIGAVRWAETRLAQPAPVQPTKQEGETLWTEIMRYAETEVIPNPDRLKEWAWQIRRWAEAAPVQQVAVDAARYRWLRGGVRSRQGLPTNGERVIGRDKLRNLMEFRFWCTPEELDAAIDAALQPTQGAKGGA